MAKLHASSPPATPAATACMLLLLLLSTTFINAALAESWKCQQGWNVAGWDSCRTCKPRYILTPTLTACQQACESGSYIGDSVMGFVDRRDCEFVVLNMKGECWLKRSWNNGGNGRTEKEYGTIACRKVA